MTAPTADFGELASHFRDVTITLVGDLSDLHVRAVVEELTGDFALVNPALLESNPYTVHLSSANVDGLNVWENVSRGWIRRVAPAGWLRASELDDREGAIKTAWMALTTAIIRSHRVEWLTGLEEIVRAENKLHAYDKLTSVGISIPNYVVSNSSERVRELLGDDFILKPLGPGTYNQGERSYVVFTAAGSSTMTDKELRVAPFIAQSRIRALRHWRVVTVEDQCWSASLDARDLPLDWRSDDKAHERFVVNNGFVRSEMAIKAASELGLGYSSQDWIEDESGQYLIDVNPAGQWLFLPESISRAVTRSISSWLERAE